MMILQAAGIAITATALLAGSAPALEGEGDDDEYRKLTVRLEAEEGLYISPEWFQKTDVAIIEQKNLVKTLPDGEPKASEMIRLADLHFRRSVRLHDDAPARTDMRKAAVLYESVLEKYPAHHRCDHALFALVWAYKRLGDEAEAARAMTRLRERYPESDYLLEPAEYFKKHPSPNQLGRPFDTKPSVGGGPAPK